MTVYPQYEYVRIANEIAADIASGKLPVGARLPGENELKHMHGVSIGTARRVVRELRERGLVATLRAKGTYVIRQSADGSGAESGPGSAEDTDPS